MAQVQAMDAAVLSAHLQQLVRSVCISPVVRASKMYVNLSHAWFQIGTGVAEMASGVERDALENPVPSSG